MECPFKVGDRIHEMIGVPTISTITHGVLKPYADFRLEKDTTKPDATVIEITKSGFRYRYDVAIGFGRAAWGQSTQEGECYPGGYHLWSKVS